MGALGGWDEDVPSGDGVPISAGKASTNEGSTDSI